MRLNNIKRIVKEDFAQDDQSLVEKLAFSLNPLLEQLTNAFNKNIDYENLNREVLIVDVEVLATGVPKTPVDMKTSLKTKISGATVVRTQNLTNDGTFPTAAPFLSFTTSGDLITIKHVAGIPANKKYRLYVEVIG